MEYTLENADKFIRENKDKVNPKYRLKYHLMPPIGWMNDPNGLYFKDGKYHLFYQFYPYEPKWGPMHWGHATSSDLVRFKDEKVALSPQNQDVESGCFSGGAIIGENQVDLVYTRFYLKDGPSIQKIFKATSTNDSDYSKSLGEIFDNETLPDHLSRNEFRDPSPCRIGDDYYIFIGSTDKEIKNGRITVLKSDKLSDFKYDFEIGPFYELGIMGECPSYLRIDGVDILIASGLNVSPKGNLYKNRSVSVFMVGKIDFEKKKMDVYSIKEIDKGDTFYAPQNFAGRENVIIGWFEMWNKEYPTAKLGHNWAGALSFPRVLALKDYEVYQTPLDTIKNYYKKSYTYTRGEISRTSDVSFVLKRGESVEFKSVNGSFLIGNECGYVYLDTENANNLNGCVRRTDYSYESAKIRALLDVSGIEIFVGDGRETISSRVYLDSDYTLDLKGNIDITVNELNL